MGKKNLLYYLDTCTIASLGSNIIHQFVKKCCFISSMVIGELSKGIETNFNSKKGFFKIIEQSGITIDWRSFNTAHMEAFGYKLFGRQLKNELIAKEIYLNTLSFESYEEAMSKRQHSQFYSDKDYYSIANYSDSVIQGYLDLRKNLTGKIKERQYNRGFENILDDFLYYCKKGVHNVRQKINDPGWENHRVIVPKTYKYNGDLDIVVNALLAYLEIKEDVNKNDTFDVFHFSYLKKGMNIVSNDKLIHRIGSLMEDNPVISLDDFLSLSGMEV